MSNRGRAHARRVLRRGRSGLLDHLASSVRAMSANLVARTCNLAARTWSPVPRMRPALRRAPQPEPIEIHRCRRRGSARLFKPHRNRATTGRAMLRGELLGQHAPERNGWSCCKSLCRQPLRAASWSGWASRSRNHSCCAPTRSSNRSAVRRSFRLCLTTRAARSTRQSSWSSTRRYHQSRRSRRRTSPVREWRQ